MFVKISVYFKIGIFFFRYLTSSFPVSHPPSVLTLFINIPISFHEKKSLLNDNRFNDFFY